MGTRRRIGSWPVYRQLTGPDRRGLGAAADSGKFRQARTSTADAVVKSVCPYCAVGCGQNIFVKDGTVVQIEGDPDSPVSRGRLCPKGSASLQLTTGGSRQYKVQYRRPFGTEFEDLDLDTAMDMIADRVLAARRQGWQWDVDGDRTRRTLGFASLGGATGFQQDLVNADCIVIEGSNMAECHPVGFQWVMEAKARGATVIHVDPRFTRTSAMADLHVPLRAGSDIVFLGGIINYVLAGEKYFRDYVVNYTNAAVLVTEDFTDTEDLDGVFSGLDREHRTYDFEAWRYQGGEVSAAAGDRDRPEEEHGPAHRQVRQAGRGEAHGSGGAAAHRDPDRDETLQHPRCVFQVLKRHFARYTPDMVEQACGVPPEVFARVCELVTENSGPERTTAFVYSVGWTQHTVGAQYIRTAAILQLLLGNIGRPGGGILALRGHASIQGSTDIPTLFDLLPGYLPMPHVHGNEDLAAQIAGDCPGYFLFGENPAVGSANGRMQRFGLANLDWLVVRDLVMIESATFWQNGPEIETGEMRTQDIKTEVFFLPAAAHTEKNGSLTNTQRMLQWHHEAVEPGEDARSDLWFAYHLGRRIREKLAASADEMDRPVKDLTWDYPVEGPLAEPSAEAVLAEVNGWDADGKPLSSYTQLTDDGSTACGCWIYCGVRAAGVNQAARRKPGSEQSWVAPEWGWAWPANRRI